MACRKEYMVLPLTEGAIHLPDGRKLGFSEFGDPTGKPLFYFHGLPGSRLEAAFAHEAAARQGLRVIGLDRPGFGLSSFQPHRRILDWPLDVAAVADTLQLPRFGVFGISGGCPYILACAATMPERLVAVGEVCGLGPLQLGIPKDMWLLPRVVLSLVRKSPGLVRPFLILVGMILRHGAKSILRLAPYLAPAPDNRVFRDPRNRALLGRSFSESVRSGAQGAIWDMHLALRPWGFDVARIKPTVLIWHGEADSTVPVDMGRQLASALPHCRAEFVPNEGHFSLPLLHMERVLSFLGQEMNRTMSVLAEGDLVP